MDINFELYKIFYHAARKESFSQAAAELFISQSAVSQAIKNLETQLGSELFFRKTRNLRLSPEGELLFHHIAQAYNFIKTAENKLTEIHNLESGELRIGASDTVCRYYLLPLLEQFTRKYPHLKLRVINRTSTRIIELLKDGEVDLGIATLPQNDPDLSVTLLTTVRDIFVAAPKYSFRKLPVPLAEVCQSPLLLLEKTSITRRNLDEFLDSIGLMVEPEIELESVDSLVDFARIGLGIAYVLQESAAQAIARGELLQIPTVPNPPVRQLGLVTVRSVPSSEAAKRFSCFLANSKNISG